MLPLRTRLFIIISLAILAILGVGIFLYVRGVRSDQPASPTGQQTQTPSGSTGQTTGQQNQPVKPAPAKIPTTLEAEQNHVRQLAKTFMERYSTYSSENNYQNIRDVAELVTKTLWNKISGRLNTPPTISPFFTGVTAQAVSASLVDWAPPRAEIEINLRKDTEKNGQRSTEYQTYRVIMLKQSAEWYVDSFVAIK